MSETKQYFNRAQEEYDRTPDEWKDFVATPEDQAKMDEVADEDLSLAMQDFERRGPAALRQVERVQAGEVRIGTETNKVNWRD